jgi:hypothetical protein
MKSINVRFTTKTYQRDKLTVWNAMEGTADETRLPDKLSVTQTVRTDLRRNGATHVTEGNGFFTGIIPIGKGIYYGDHYADKKSSLVAVKLSLDGEHMTVYYFRNFNKRSHRLRAAFLHDFFNKL